MTDATWRPLRDLRIGDAPVVGGKAAGLGELLTASARVPDGFVVTTAGAHLRASERKALVSEVARVLGDGPFAVRSSGVAEDSSERSFAGMYETVLDVPLGEVPQAVEHVLGSSGAPRVERYAAGAEQQMAIIVQRMVPAIAAGVALTADPVNGDRSTVVVTAVRGTGERLVSGKAFGDEWHVKDRIATATRQPERAIDRMRVTAVADEARRIATVRGTPQDVEWAFDGDGRLWILQARPMTALPPDVSWEPPAPGVYARSLRFGEWISEPVTPLFESWLLTTMEGRFHARLKDLVGQRSPLPIHVLVNGWYFYSLNWIRPGNIPHMLWKALRSPRVVAGILPETVRHSLPLMEREWRDEVQPRYRSAVARDAQRLATVPVTELPALIDGLAELAGEYFTSLAGLGGAAYKLEILLARFYRRHLARALGDNYVQLLAGLDGQLDPGPLAVASLDWWQAPGLAHGGLVSAETDRRRLVEARETAEAAAEAALASSPRRLRTFRRIVADAQRLVPIREAQVRELTLAWPVMREAVLRIGGELVRRGVITAADDVFFLTREEVLAALGGEDRPRDVEVTARRALREDQARLVPPLFAGRLNAIQRRLIATYVGAFGGARSERALVSGFPASPGRASGLVRVIRGPDDFDDLQAGEVLVAPLTAPAWTPLFARAAAVVTDVGSPAAHASLIAREFGIPAVVGCGDATARLVTGMRVAVDGTTGNVEPG